MPSYRQLYLEGWTALVDTDRVYVARARTAKAGYMTFGAYKLRGSRNRRCKEWTINGVPLPKDGPDTLNGDVGDIVRYIHVHLLMNEPTYPERLLGQLLPEDTPCAPR